MRVGITGHRGLPKAIEDDVRRMLVERAGEFDPRELVALSCIADGPDTWWAQIALQVGGQLEVIIPAEEYRDGLPAWHHRDYDELMRLASDVHRTGLRESTSQAHQAGSEILVGLSDLVLAVWDGKPARGFGGTADVVAYAQRLGVPVWVLWPEGAER